MIKGKGSAAGTSNVRNTVTSGIQHHGSQTIGTESQNYKEKVKAKELLTPKKSCVLVVLLNSARSSAILLLMIFFIYLFSKHFRSEEVGAYHYSI